MNDIAATPAFEGKGVTWRAVTADDLNVIVDSGHQLVEVNIDQDSIDRRIDPDMRVTFDSTPFKE